MTARPGCIAVGLLALAACPRPGRTISPSSPDAPDARPGASARHAHGGRLVVLVITDGEMGSLARTLASLSTGKSTLETGIIGDVWWSRDERRFVHADERGQMRGSAIGDEVIAHHGRAIAVTFDPALMRLVVGAHGTVIPVAAVTPDDKVIIETAHAVIRREHLGRRNAADLLVVRLGAAAAEPFTSTLDHEVGRGRWSLVSVAAPPPSTTVGPYSIEQLQRVANDAASLELGGGTWIAAVNPPSIYLSPAALAQRRPDLKKAVRKVIFALRSLPGLGLVDRADAYEGNCDARESAAKALCLSLDPSRAGDVVITGAGDARPVLVTGSLRELLP